MITVLHSLLETIHTLARDCQRLVLAIFNFPLEYRGALLTAIQYLEDNK